jgi:cytochrome c biogenesis protein CcmG, thiol:disulfide interchange protein DsbE
VDEPPRPDPEPGAPRRRDPPRGSGDRRRLVAAAGTVAAVGAVLALLVVGLLNRDVGTDISEALAAGERPDAPDLTLPVLAAGDGVGPAGGELALADLRGRTVVLNVWASWCPPCEEEAPLLEELARGYRAAGADVLVLGLDVRDLREDALAFIRDRGVTYPSLRDEDDRAYRALEVTGQPETFVIDPRGRIALRHVGPVTELAPFRQAVARVAGEAAPA